MSLGYRRRKIQLFFFFFLSCKIRNKEEYLFPYRVEHDRSAVRASITHGAEENAISDANDTGDEEMGRREAWKKKREAFEYFIRGPASHLSHSAGRYIRAAVLPS